jgi:RNA polymerase sigma-70 factor (ECF subfamily)
MSKSLLQRNYVASGQASRRLTVVDWDELIEEHGPLVVGISWRILGNSADVQDNVQEVFISAWKVRQTQEVDHWRGLLRRLATVAALASLRRRRQHASIDTEVAIGGGRLPEEAAIEKELDEQLRRAVAELPEREAAVFTLKYFEQLDLQEVSSVLAISYSAAAKALSRARSKLGTVFGSPNAEK